MTDELKAREMPEALRQRRDALLAQMRVQEANSSGSTAQFLRFTTRFIESLTRAGSFQEIMTEQFEFRNNMVRATSKVEETDPQRRAALAGLLKEMQTFFVAAMSWIAESFGGGVEAVEVVQTLSRSLSQVADGFVSGAKPTGAALDVPVPAPVPEDQANRDPKKLNNPFLGKIPIR